MADGACDHEWQLVEVDFSARGAERGHECGLCGAVTYEPSQAAARPPL